MMSDAPLPYDWPENWQLPILTNDQLAQLLKSSNKAVRINEHLEAVIPPDRFDQYECDATGQTLLTLAVDKRDIQRIDLLAAYQPNDPAQALDVNARHAINHYTPLHMVVATPNAVMSFGTVRTRTATRKMNSEQKDEADMAIISLLARMGCDPSLRTPNGPPALFLAIQHHRSARVIQHFIDVFTRPETPCKLSLLQLDRMQNSIFKYVWGEEGYITPAQFVEMLQQITKQRNSFMDTKHALLMGTHPRLGRDSPIYTFFGRHDPRDIFGNIFSYLKHEEFPLSHDAVMEKRATMVRDGKLIDVNMDDDLVLALQQRQQELRMMEEEEEREIIDWDIEQ